MSLINSLKEKAEEAVSKVEGKIDDLVPQDAENAPEETSAEQTEQAPTQEGSAEQGAASEPKEEEGGPDLDEMINSIAEQPAEHVFSEEDVAVAPSGELPYHERYYLKYKEGKRSAAMDLDGTIAFLRKIGFDGGELRQAREGKNTAEQYEKNAEPNGNQMFCSYCGTEISGVEFYRLPDGRMRCTTCSSTVVNSKDEVKQICERVLTTMENFFGATIDVPVDIEVMDERKLKKKVGIGTKDSQSILILGVAINKKKQYSLIIENGAPRISVIATFAHELTHIWQYINWDANKKMKKCPKKNRLLIYEGMAKWVEIQYLYLIGETEVARREEFITRNRQDEYGIGFLLYEDQYPLTREAMSCDSTPFTVGTYPLS